MMGQTSAGAVGASEVPCSVADGSDGAAAELAAASSRSLAPPTDFHCSYVSMLYLPCFNLFTIIDMRLVTSAEEGGYVFGSVCLSVCLFVCLSVCLSVGRITRRLVNGC